MGSTGRWPQVVNIWECIEGRTGWRRLMESTNLSRTTQPRAERVVEDRARGALGWVRPAARRGARVPDDRRPAPRRGQRLGVRARALGVPARAPRSTTSRRCAQEWVPVLADYGHALVGLYEVMMTDTEVMTVWATDPEGHEALGRAIDAEGPIRASSGGGTLSRRVPHPLARGAHDAVPRHPALPRRPAVARRCALGESDGSSGTLTVVAAVNEARARSTAGRSASGARRRGAGCSTRPATCSRARACGTSASSTSPARSGRRRRPSTSTSGTSRRRCSRWPRRSVSRPRRSWSCSTPPWAGEGGLERARRLVDGFLLYWDDHRAVLRTRNLAAQEGDQRFRDVRNRRCSRSPRACRARSPRTRWRASPRTPRPPRSSR